MTTTVARPNPLRRLWARLPTGPLEERELDDQILLITGRVGDYAWAGAMRSALVSARAVTATRREDGRLEYMRGEWTGWPENGPGSPGFNAELARRAAEHEAMLRLDDEARERELANSPAGRQRQDILDLIDSRIDERVTALVDARVAELTGSAAVVAHPTDSAGAGPREGD
jgi:hypothetical protein